MFYISRHIGASYGLWDTDHCNEMRVSVSDLLSMHASGIEVAGLCVAPDGAVAARPYQEPDTVTMQQVKARTLWHVNSTLFGQFITNLVWDTSEITNPVRIKLSTLGSICADSMLYGNLYCFDARVTLVLDDAITATAQSFDCGVSPRSIGIKYDVSDVTRPDLLKAVYKTFAPFRGKYISDEQLADCIIDRDASRKDYYIKVVRF